MEVVIGEEFGRNIGLAVASVFLVTMLTLGDPVLCGVVLMAVGLTLTDVIGILYFWGMNMDQVSFVCIIITVGMSVDYSLHIAHAYKLETGLSKLWYILRAFPV